MEASDYEVEVLVDGPEPAEYVETESARLLSPPRAMLDSDETTLPSVELKVDVVVAAVVTLGLFFMGKGVADCPGCCSC